MIKKKFIAQIGNNNTVKIFDIQTGQLHRVITIEGTITTPPVCSETEMVVGVQRSNVQYMNVYTVPAFTLKRTITA